jgi:hypothetical protein
VEVKRTQYTPRYLLGVNDHLRIPTEQDFILEDGHNMFLRNVSYLKVHTRSTRGLNPEDQHRHLRRKENFKYLIQKCLVRARAWSSLCGTDIIYRFLRAKCLGESGTKMKEDKLCGTLHNECIMVCTDHVVLQGDSWEVK